MLAAPPAYAVEARFYAAAHGLSASFYLLGGRYNIYVYAKRPIVGAYAPESRRLNFGRQPPARVATPMRPCRSGRASLFLLVLLPETDDLGRALCTNSPREPTQVRMRRDAHAGGVPFEQINS